MALSMLDTYGGRDFTAGGVFVGDLHLICYPARPDFSSPAHGDVRTWDGRTIGRYAVTGHASGFGGRLTCYRVTLDDGRVYVGRGLGHGLILRCRRVTSQRTTHVPTSR